MGLDRIALIFEPQPDITAYELALCLPWLEPRSLKLSDIDSMAYPRAEIRRHFRCMYDPSNPDAVEFAKKFDTNEATNKVFTG